MESGRYVCVIWKGGCNLECVRGCNIHIYVEAAKDIMSYCVLGCFKINVLINVYI